jgi:hypothetical protein
MFVDHLQKAASPVKLALNDMRINRSEQYSWPVCIMQGSACYSQFAVATQPYDITRSSIVAPTSRYPKLYQLIEFALQFKQTRVKTQMLLCRVMRPAI